MKTNARWLAALASCTVVSILACACGSQAATKPMAMPVPSRMSAAARGGPAIAPVRVDAAWVRAAPPGTDMLAGYMDVHNLGKTPLHLVSAESDAFATVELHRSRIAGGVSSMQSAGAQDIPAGGKLSIQPGGLHWMLMQPRRPLKVGDVVHFTLRFDYGGTAEATAIVRMAAP